MDRDWPSFERKLQRGKLIEQAAEEAGIPVDEGVAWLAAKRGKSKDDEALRILSAEALHHGITTLIELTKIRVQAGLKLRDLIKPPAKDEGEPKDLFDRPAANWSFPPKR